LARLVRLPSPPPPPSLPLPRPPPPLQPCAAFVRPNVCANLTLTPTQLLNPATRPTCPSRTARGTTSSGSLLFWLHGTLAVTGPTARVPVQTRAHTLTLTLKPLPPPLPIPLEPRPQCSRRQAVVATRETELKRGWGAAAATRARAPQSGHPRIKQVSAPAVSFYLTTSRTSVSSV